MSPASTRLSLGFSCIGHAFMHVLSALYLTVVLGLERDWAIGYDELIRLWTIGSLMIGVGAPLAGWLGDRWSDAKMMVVFFLLTGAGSIASGLAGGTTGWRSGWLSWVLAHRSIIRSACRGRSRTRSIAGGRSASWASSAVWASPAPL